MAAWPPIANTDPLVVTPRVACRLLSLGNTRIYELIRNGELDSYIDGQRARRITVASIRRYIARHLPADVASTEHTPVPKRARGRPRKTAALGGGGITQCPTKVCCE
jgi:excisionase family DNA binding protein